MLLFMMSFCLFGDAQAEVTKVVEKHYVNAVHKVPNSADFRAGFHADFVMISPSKEGLKKVDRETFAGWIESAEKKGEGPRDVRHEIRKVDVEGNSAIVSLDLYRDGKLIFTDHLALYKFDDGWKVVSKTYFRHP